MVEAEYLSPEDRIPLSTFNRLFSSKEAKRRVGVELHNEQIKLINDRDSSYKAMTRIAKDTGDKLALIFDVGNEANKAHLLP